MSSEPIVPPTKADETIAAFLELASRQIVDGVHLAIAALHCLLGVILRHMTVPYPRMDMRLSALIIQKPGTGKSLIFSLLRKLSKDLGIKYKDVGIISVPGAVGSIGKKGKITQGDFEVYEVIACDEAAHIIDPLMRGYDKGIVPQIRKALNPIGDNLLSKTVAYGKFDYTPKFSLFLVTTPPSKLDINLITEGLLSRMLVIYRDLTLDQTFKIREEIINRMTVSAQQHGFDKMNEQQLYQKVVSDLRNVKEFFKNKTQFSVPDSNKQKLHDINRKLTEQLYPYPSHTRELLDNFTNRFMLNYTRIAAHHAALDLRTDVNDTDLAYADKLLTEEWANLLAFVDKHIQARKSPESIITQSIIEYLKEHRGRALSSEVKEYAMKRSGKSEPTVNSVVIKLEDGKIVRRVYQGKELWMILLNPTKP